MAEGRLDPGAWQPFTPGGVARFAYARIGRLLAAAGIIAVICGAVVGWFLGLRWAPVIEQAISQLPSQSSISEGALHWPTVSGQKLAGNQFVALVVNPAGGALSKDPADVLVEFQGASLVVRSELGFLNIPYPKDLSIPLTKANLDPLWGAWKPALLAGAGLLTALGLMLAWALLALIYAVVPGFIGLYLDREITFSGAWKLSCAALLPGAVIMCFGVALYALGEATLLHLCIIAAAHLLIIWPYLLLAPICLQPMQKKIAGKKGNPFQGENEPEFAEPRED